VRDKKKDQRYQLFITSANVGRFSKFFNLWIQPEICNNTFDMAGMALRRIINNASHEWCGSSNRTTFLVFSLTADSTFVHFNVLVW